MTERRPRSPLAVTAVLAAMILTSCGSDETGRDDADPTAFCRQFDAFTELIQAAGVGPEDVADVPATSELADDIVEAAATLPGAAPDDIRDDVRTLARLSAEIFGDLRDFYERIADDPSLANDPEFLASFNPLTDERLEALTDAGEEVRPEVSERCDRDLEIPETTEPPAPAPPAEPEPVD